MSVLLFWAVVDKKTPAAITQLQYELYRSVIVQRHGIVLQRYGNGGRNSIFVAWSPRLGHKSLTDYVLVWQPEAACRRLTSGCLRLLSQRLGCHSKQTG